MDNCIEMSAKLRLTNFFLHLLKKFDLKENVMKKQVNKCISKVADVLQKTLVLCDIGILLSYLFKYKVDLCVTCTPNFQLKIGINF